MSRIPRISKEVKVIKEPKADTRDFSNLRHEAARKMFIPIAEKHGLMDMEGAGCYERVEFVEALEEGRHDDALTIALDSHDYTKDPRQEFEGEGDYGY